MWKLALLFLSSNLWAQVGPTEKSFIFPEFRECGLVTRYSSNKINPNCLQSSNNFLYDEDFSLLRRNGYAKYNATPCTDAQTVRGLWKFDAVDGKHYMVILSSSSMFQTSGEGSCTAIPGLVNFSKTAEMECVQGLGSLWCANGVDSLFYWDGTSTAAVSNAPVAPHIGVFRNRIWLGDVSGSRTRLRGSGELDGTDWTLFVPGRSTTSVSIDIAGTNDGNNVSCMMGEFQGAFIVGRPDDLNAIYGYDRRDFTLRKISKEIGCIEPKSVQEKNNALYWLSKRGVERYTGSTIERASDLIRPTIDNIVQSAGNTFTKAFSSQSEFTGGNSVLCASGPRSCSSAILSPGNIVVSTWYAQDTSDTDFASWTSSVGVSTNVFSGSLTLAVDTMTFSGASSFSGWTTVNEAPGTGFVPHTGDNSCNLQYPAGAYVASDIMSNGNPCSATGENASVKIEVFNGATMISSGVIGTPQFYTVGCTTQTLIIPSVVSIPNQGTGAKIRFTMTGAVTGSRNYVANQVYTESPISIPMGRRVAYAQKIYDSGGACHVDFSLPALNEYLRTGTFTSRTFDTNISTPIWGPIIISSSPGNSSPATASILTAASSDGVTWDSPSASFPNGTQIPSANKRYIRYSSQFSTISGTTTPKWDDVSLTAATTAYYISDCAQPSSAISSWNSFLVNDSANNGSFTFWTATGTACSQATALNANWVSQLPNSAISNATSTFIAARVLFSVDSGTQNPTLNDITFGWNEGTARPPTASAVYRDRYWLFYTTSTLTGAHNDHAVVADASDKWSLMDDINAYSATVYNRKLYTGESTATGFLYQQDIGQSDNNGSYTASFQTADIDLGNPVQKKLLKTVYVYLQPPTDPSQAIAPTFNYYIDGSTVPYALGAPSLSESSERAGYFVAKMPVPASQPSTFHWFNLGMTSANNVGPLRIFGIQVIYEPLEME